MAPLAGSVTLSSSTGITFRPSAAAVAPHHRPASSQATLLSSYDALASSRLSAASSTSGRSPITGGRTGYKIATPVCQAALFGFLKRNKDKELVKGELLLEIARLDRGAEASAEDQERIDKIVKELEALNPTKEPLNSSLINGKWLLLYTTSETILKKNRQKFLRPSGPIYQAINTDTLRAQNLETWPFFNQVTANLTPVSPKKVVVNFDYFKIAGLLAARSNGYIHSCSRNKDSSDVDAVKGIAGGKQLETSDMKSRFCTRVTDQTWCALCGSGSGWIECGKCMGKGAFATRPGLAGVKAKVGWACCKACYGKTVVPCILCGVDGVQEWERWQQSCGKDPQRRMIKVKAPGRARGELEITYLDNDLRVSRGDKGNLFILQMLDPSYRVPVYE